MQTDSLNSTQVNGVLNAVRYMNGGDIGAGINAAYAALSSAGGKIFVPPQASGSPYSFSTPIVFNTQNKPVIIEGVPGATVLQFTPTTGTAILFNNGQATGTSPHYRNNGLTSISLLGPGSSTATIGLDLGGTNGAEGLIVERTKIGTFGTGAKWENNTWGTRFCFSIFLNCGQCVLIPNGIANAGENVLFEDCFFAGDAAATFTAAVEMDLSIADVHFSHCSFDNTQLLASSGIVHVDKCHFETSPTVNITTRYINNTGANMCITNTLIQQDATSGSMPSEFVKQTAGNMLASGNVLFTAGGTTVPIGFNIAGGVFFEFGTINYSAGGGAITTFVSNSGATNSIVSGMNESFTVKQDAFLTHRNVTDVEHGIEISRSDLTRYFHLSQMPSGYAGGAYALLLYSYDGTTFRNALAVDYSNNVKILGNAVLAGGAAPTVSAGQVGLGSTTATTVGAAGAASALPANPVGYLIINVAGTAVKVPYYNN